MGTPIVPTTKMTGKERILAAIRCQPVDHVPCAPWFFNNRALTAEPWKSQRERCQYFRDRLGVDGYVHAGLGPRYSPTVTSEFWTSDGGQVLNKAFHTPDGDLTASIRTDEKLPTRDDIELVSDFNPPLYIKPWIETLEDVERFKHLCQPPDESGAAAFRERSRESRSLADEFRFPLMGDGGTGLTGLLVMMGGEQAVLASMDRPELLKRFMDIEHAANMRRIEIMLDAGVDIIRRNGFYETCDFWNPQQVRDVVLPRVNEEAALVHARGGVLIYTVCTGILPLLDLYLESEIDCLIGAETKLCGQTLPPIAAKLMGKICLWGGVSDCEDLGRGTPDDTRRAVREAFELIGRRGFILSAVPSIKPERPPENVDAMFDEWRRLR